MRFSLYTEIQLHPRARRRSSSTPRCSSRSSTPTGSATTLRGDRALLLPEVLDLGEPDRALRRRRADARGTSASGRCSTRCRTTTRRCWRPSIARDRHPHGRPLRVGRRARSRLDPRRRRACPSTSTRGRGTRRRSTCSSRRSATSGSPTHGEYFDVDDSHIVPFPTAAVPRSSSAAPRTARTRSRPSAAGASPSRRSCPTRCSRSSSTSTARSAPSTAPSRTSSGSTPATSTRTATPRCARRATGSSASSTATARRCSSTRSPSAEGLGKAGYGFYAAGIMEQLAEVPFEQLVEEDYVWVGTPDEIVQRIEETRERLRRRHGDRDHGQRRRRAALDGDQEPGALRVRGDPARPCRVGHDRHGGRVGPVPGIRVSASSGRGRSGASTRVISRRSSTSAS